MLTAAITAAITAILGLFGVKPGAWIVGVAIGVKVIIVAVTLVVGARLMRKRNALAGKPGEPGPPPQPPAS
jgi:amino acid transporter